ncbi:MAG TPA: hypothetical protein VIF09_00445 [Polyangiaceae bacterium]|jgi:hypothetical protein
MKRCGLVLLACATLALATATGCRQTQATGCPGSESAGPAVDESLLAFLSAARSLHHEADVKVAAGDRPGAVAALERLVALPAPHAVEVDEVLADAHARLAELRLQTGDLAGAQNDVQAGLEHVSGPTYFRGHLLEVEGLVAEARASSLADAGKADEATRARGRAVALLEEAVQVQQQVIEHALGDGGH